MSFKKVFTALIKIDIITLVVRNALELAGGSSKGALLFIPLLLKGGFLL
jgi:hypothetical protein